MVKEKAEIKLDSESKVLKALGIKAFESIDDAKIKKLALLFPKMDHELVKSIINQMPEFCHTAEIITTTYKEITIKAMEKEDSFTAMYLEQGKILIDEFNKDINCGDLSPEEKEEKVNCILQIMEFERDVIVSSREYKRTNQLAAALLATFIFLSFGVVTLVTLNSNSDYSDEKINCESEDK